MEYQIRYTCSGDLQASVVEFITRNAEKFIVCREFASREHIQGYIVTSVVKKTWVNKFNKQFGKQLNARDKYVEPDKGNTKHYVCKGADVSTLPIVLAKRSYTDEDIKIFHDDYWKNIIPEEIQNICMLPPEIKPEKVKKPPKPTFMKLIRQELEDEYPNKDWTSKDKIIVFKKLMFMLGHGCKNLDHIIISRMTYGVLNSLIKDKKEWLEYWYQKSFGEVMFCDDTNENYELDE